EAMLVAGRRHVEALRHEGTELGLVARAGVLGNRLPLAVLAREPASFERAPHDRAEAVRTADGEDLALHLAGEDRVRGLRGDEALEVAPVADPEGFDHLPATEVDAAGFHQRAGRHAEVAHLPLSHEVAERAD